MVIRDKNIILLSIECLSTDHLHYMGYPKKITPTLDKLASQGYSFFNAFSTATWTPASFKSILCSRYPLMDGGTLSIQGKMPNIPKILKEEGFKTAAIVPPGWFQAILQAKYFDTFTPSKRIKRAPKYLVNFLERIKTVSKKVSSQKKIKERKNQNFEKSNFKFSEFASYFMNFKQIFPPFAKHYTKRANTWIEEHKNCNFFLLLHYPDTHEKYYPSSPFISFSSFLEIKKANEKSMKNNLTANPWNINLSEKELKLLIRLYDEKIRIIDRAISGIVKKLAETNLLNETYIIITADHGQEFLDHGGYGHGLHLYNEVINVPLILLGPGIGKQEIKTPVSLLDIAPTILNLLNLNKNEEFVGSSLLSERERKKKAKIGIISEDGREKRNDHMLKEGELKIKIKNKKIALVSQRWKYIFREKGEDELYHLKDDPKERENLYHKKPSIVSRMKKKVLNHIEFEKQQSWEWKNENKLARIREKIGR